MGTFALAYVYLPMRDDLWEIVSKRYKSIGGKRLMSEQNICKQCGGQKTVYYTIEPCYSNGFTPMIHAVTSSSRKICACPIPTQKHDGDLGHNASVCYQDATYSGDNGSFTLEEVSISDKMRHVWLTPSEALSLLVWLQQEKERLEELAKEQCND